MSFCQESLRCAQYCSKGVQKGSPDLIGGYQTGGETQHGTAGYSYPVTTYSEHDFK